MFGRSLQILDRQAYVLNLPLSLTTTEPNNATMRELSAEERSIDLPRALAQWYKVYSFLASNSIVYLVPSREGLQDLAYVANLGVVLHHVENQVVISNFRSPPRVGETEMGCRFFREMGYDVTISPPFFEGEADLKYVRDNMYVGGYGLRTSREALEWFGDRWDMHIVLIRTHDEHLYHLDCTIFPLTNEKVMVCMDACTREEIKQLERIAELIPVGYDVAIRGITNLVRCNNYLLCDSFLDEIPQTHPLYEVERKKRLEIERISSDNGLELVIYSLSEFYKSGAMLSCMVMHLNHRR